MAGQWPRAHLCLLGREVVIAAETAELLAGAAFLLGRASAAGRPGLADLHAVLRGVPGGGARLEVGGESYGGSGPEAASAGAAATLPLMAIVARQARSRLVLHAAAVDRGGGALLLAGPSGSGKSTLAASLALGGAALLGDELAVLVPATAMVEPFLRPVGIRPGPLSSIVALAPGRAVSLEVPEPDGSPRRFVDLVGAGLARAGRPSPVRHVVLLDPGIRPPTAADRPRMDEIGGGVGLTRLAAHLLGPRPPRAGAGGLLLALAHSLSGARYWRLQAGSLPATRACLEDLP